MPETLQKIARLTPLADVLARLDALAQPVQPRQTAAADGAGLTLAADIAATARPRRAIALVDGWAVTAADVADASGYAPVAFPKIPPRVETGDEMPPGADAVLPPDAVIVRGAQAEAVAAVAPGEGVLAPGGDIDAAKPLFVARHRLRTTDLAVLAAAEISSVEVRSPRLTVAMAREDVRLVPAMQFIVGDCVTQGCAPQVRNGFNVEALLAARDADAVVIVGGTGSGARDNSVTTLACVGQVAAYGIGIAPGSTAALGEAAGKPVLIVPGRLDAAIAAWLLIGRRMLGRLLGAGSEPIASRYRLTRKVTSTVGLCELVPVRCTGEEAEPLAHGYLTLSALARANGYVAVPAASEGYAAGSEVAVHDWP